VLNKNMSACADTSDGALGSPCPEM